MNNWTIIQIFGLKYSDILHKSVLVLLGLNYGGNWTNPLFHFASVSIAVP